MLMRRNHDKPYSCIFRGFIRGNYCIWSTLLFFTYKGLIMSIHHHSKVNALTNPVTSGDIIIAESGERYIVKQTICGDYWLRHIKDNFDLTHPVSGQIGIIRQIVELANI